jgi:hypothetical protein
MVQGPELENFPDAGHEKDQAEDETGKQYGPGAIGTWGKRGHWFQSETLAF